MTPTPTITPTPSPTPDVFLVFTTPGGADAAITRVVRIGDYVEVILLFAIVITLWVIWLNYRARVEQP